MTRLLMAILLLTVSLVPAAAGASNPFAEQDPIAPPTYGELPGLRSENSRTVANPDGTNTVTFSQGPIHYRAPDGTWATIDTTIPPSGKVEKAKYKATNKKESTAPLTLTYEGGVITFTPQKAKNVEAVISGSTATYQGMWKDADLVRTYTPTGVKEDIVLHTSKASSEYTWNVSTNFEVLQVGNSLRLSKAGQVAGWVTAPYATHAGGEDVGYVWLVWDSKKSEIRYVLDDQWRSTATYPIVIDPSTEFSPSAGSDDGYATRQQAAYPPGCGACSQDTTDTVINVAQEDAGGGTYRVRVGLVRWDTSSLADDATLLSATLTIWPTTITNTDSKSFSAGWFAGTNWPIDNNDWTSTNQTSAFGLTALSSFTTGEDNVINLSNVNTTNIVRTGYTGMRFTVSSGTPTGLNDLRFRSSEHASGSPPRLTVTYIGPCTVTTSAASGLSMTSAGVVTGTFNGNLTDDGDSDTLTGSFEFGMTDSYGSESATIALSDAGAYTRPLSSSSLTPGGTLHYRAKVVNEAGTCNGADTTSALTMPTVTTSAATSVEFNFDGTTAVLNGNMSALGIATGAFVLFEYGTTASYGTETTPVDQTGTGTFSATITGWDGEATMHYRAIARINGVDSVGSDVTFTVNSPGWFLLAKLAPLMGMVLVVFSTIGFFGGSALSYRNGNASTAAWLLMGGVVMISLGLPLVVAIITNSTGFFNP